MLENLQYQYFKISPSIPSQKLRLSLHNAPRQDDCVRVVYQLKLEANTKLLLPFAEVNPAIATAFPETHDRAILNYRCSMTGAWEQLSPMRGGAHLLER
jgi:hypothetical protein